MNIDALLEQARACALNHTSMTFPDSWAQGRTAFGGLSAALLYAAMKTQVADDRPLRSLTTNFVGPLLADTEFCFQVELLREGKSASQLTARIIQNGQVAVLQQASFGVERFSEIEVNQRRQHGLPQPEQLSKMPFLPGVTPNFIQHVELAIAEGALPYSGNRSAQLSGWMRFGQPPKIVTDAHLIGLIDAWPPAVLQMMKAPAPVSTMMWNLEFIHPHPPAAGSDWFAYKAITRQAANGYAHLEADIWDHSGDLVAISRQSVAVFA
ncbi:acyl-CoA thioesterase [Ferrimonas marina]|uniref:Acyl-CoA thioesterase n=1 Tax=Ferrimonas marina TaxID=299255 RepID=A0A1M5X0Q5_9GAMM|nr:thioesterase family protein [Ferrimonas marina]SHH93505.1 Acyl-CoA thioesterase [Ferrimonas marina]